MVPSDCLTAPVTPAFPFPPFPTGHSTAFPDPTSLFHVSLSSESHPVKTAVVPDSSALWTVVMDVLGRLAPRFWPAISGSFQVLTLPRKMSATVGPSSFSPEGAADRLYATTTPPKTV